MITKRSKLVYFNVQARRKGTETWTAWSITVDIDSALKQADVIDSLGHESRILVERLNKRLFNKNKK
jgi:hypothetical protein